MTQPEAMRLAQALNNRQECEDEAADELRRLHAENQRIEPLAERVLELKAQRDALLEACQTLVNLPEDWIATLRLLRVAVEQARAAIKAVEEEA